MVLLVQIEGAVEVSRVYSILYADKEQEVTISSALLHHEPLAMRTHLF